MSLVQWFDSQHSNVVNGWLHDNPRFDNSEESAALLYARVGNSPTTKGLDAAWKDLQAHPVSREIDTDTHGLDSQPAWTLGNALWARIETCPIAGTKVRLKSALAQLFTIGSAWFAAEGKFKPAETPKESQ